MTRELDSSAKSEMPACDWGPAGSWRHCLRITGLLSWPGTWNWSRVRANILARTGWTIWHAL